MAAPARRRPVRRGSHRPLVSWPLHAGLLGVSLLVPLVALLTLYQPAPPLPPAPPLQFSGSAAANQTGRLATAERDSNGACCAPGSAGELAAADWVEANLKPFDPNPRRIVFATNLPWQSQPVPMTDVIGYRPGHSPQIVAVIVHRDGASAADLAGTGLLVELSKVLPSLPRDRGLALISTDGGTTGGQGATTFATRWPPASRIVAAVVIDAAAARPGTQLRILTRPSTPHGVSPTLYVAARQAVSTWYGTAAGIPGAYDQLSGYGVPYAPGEQGTLLAHGISALTLTAGRGHAARGPLSTLDAGQLGRVGMTVANLVAELDAAPTIERDGSPVLLLSGKVMRGWLAEASMAILMAPFIACVLDLVARLRRQRVAIAPGLVAFGWRAGAWLVTLAAMWILAAAPGRLLPGIAVAPLPGRTGATTVGILIAACAGLGFWRFVSRPRLVRSEATTGEERIGGLAGGLLGLAFAGLLLTAVNPFALVIVLPAAHIWLWLPAAARSGRRTLLVVYLVGLMGPAALVAELWTAQGLGTDTPRALAAMTASGYLAPAVSVCLALAAAAAAQLGSLVLGRYAHPHPPEGGVSQRVPL